MHRCAATNKMNTIIYNNTIGFDDEYLKKHSKEIIVAISTCPEGMPWHFIALVSLQPNLGRLVIDEFKN